MLKNMSQLECEVDGRMYRFQCLSDSPLAHVKEAVFQFQKYVGQVEDAIKAQQETEKAKKDEEDRKIESEK